MITEPVARPLDYIGASGPRIASCGPNTDVGGPGLLADTGAFPMMPKVGLDDHLHHALRQWPFRCGRPHISLMRFKSRNEGKTHYRGSPTKEVGADGVERMMRPQGRKGE